MKWIGVVARLVLGGVWIAAGLLKIGDPAENVRAVRAYELLPETLVQVVGYSLPLLEILVGVLLLVGLATRWMAILSAVMLVAFIIGISSAWARGLSIECGCFGGGGGPAEGAKDKYPWELARDVGLLALSAWLIWRPRTPYALDNTVMPEVPAGTPAAVSASPATAGGGARGERTRASQQAAQLRREAAAEEQRRRNAIISLAITVAVLFVVAVGASVQSSRDTTGQDAAAPSGAVDTYALGLGPTDAAVTVDIYEDFMCPFCGQFEAASADTIDALLDTGEVQVRYHLISFLDRASTDRYSTRAMNALGVVLDSTDAETAAEFKSLLFANQPPEGGAGLSDDQLIELAVQAGADEAEVSGPINDLAFEQWVKNATDASSRAGVNSTPTVKVDGEALPQTDIETTVANLDAAVRERLE